jgi:hypothetical protein
VLRSAPVTIPSPLSSVASSGVSAEPGIITIAWPKRAENFAVVGIPVFCDFGPVGCAQFPPRHPSGSVDAVSVSSAALNSTGISRPPHRRQARARRSAAFRAALDSDGNTLSKRGTVALRTTARATAHAGAPPLTVAPRGEDRIDLIAQAHPPNG